MPTHCRRRDQLVPSSKLSQPKNGYSRELLDRRHQPDMFTHFPYLARTRLAQIVLSCRPPPPKLVPPPHKAIQSIPEAPAVPTEESNAFVPARNIVQEGVKVVSVIGLTVGPQMGKRKRRHTTSSASSSSSSSEGETDMPPLRQHNDTSVILDTAKLRARREANLAAFRAKRAAAKPQQPTVLIPAVPSMASKGFSDAPSVGFSDYPLILGDSDKPISQAVPALRGFSESVPKLEGWSESLPNMRGFSGTVDPSQGV